MSPAFDRRLRLVREAVVAKEPVSGFTHQFYKYPARFSPGFVGTAIDAFSAPGDLVLDPFMGGGTTVVEATVRGRRAIGCDLNSLAVFVARVKVNPLRGSDETSIRNWVQRVSQGFSYHDELASIGSVLCARRTKNLTLPRARPIKKFVAAALMAIDELPSKRSREFARCVLLNVSQWALNGRRTVATLTNFRERLHQIVEEMLSGLGDFRAAMRVGTHPTHAPLLIHGDCADLPDHPLFASGQKAGLVITSPPYPGIHVLYHRWQVDGRRETPAPYWIANCTDGQGNAYYNFADRRERAAQTYFEESLRAFLAVRKVMRDGGLIVQLIAFSDPRSQLPRYLDTMRTAGFAEVVFRTRDGRAQRQWRSVPGRRWYATQKGAISSSREVLLVHQAN